MSRMKVHSARYKRENKSVASVFADTLIKNPNRVCFYFDDEVWRASEVRCFLVLTPEQTIDSLNLNCIDNV